MKTKTLGFTIEYSLEVGVPATTVTGSNTNFNKALGINFPKTV